MRKDSLQSLDMIVFDFDGTICDSAGIKDEAFRILYLEEQGEAFADEVQRYHMANAGVSRFDKIVHIEERMLERSCPPERLVEIADRFGSLVEDRVVASALIAGASEFLEKHSASTTLTVASATPTEELRRIVRRRGLDRHFAAVDGSPTGKGSIIVEQMARFSVRPERTVMVGDQISDRRAAEHAGVSFVGVGSDAPQLGSTAAIVDDLFDLELALLRVFS